MTAHILIPIPVGEVLKPSINPAAGLVIKRPQSDLNGLCDDHFFHDSLPLSDGDRSQNLMIVQFLGENSAAIWPPAQTLGSDGPKAAAGRPTVRSRPRVLTILGHHKERYTTRVQAFRLTVIRHASLEP